VVACGFGWVIFYALAVELVTLLFTDIEGSTALLQRVGEQAYAEVLAGHHAVIRAALAGHAGVEVDTAGDGFFAVFASPRACVAAVLQMQRELGARAWPPGAEVRVRMGVHCGEADKTAAGLVGLDVHRAARVAGVAHGGQVLVSESAAVLVRDALPAGAALRDLGLHRLKDLGAPVRIFQLRAAGLAAEFPPLRSLGNPALQHNLPAQLTPFIGRAQERAAVRGLAGSSRLVTLTGAGGCGKTRLGLQVAAELLDGSGDGVWLVELAAVTDDNAVAAAVAAALGVAAQPGRSALEALGEALKPQDVLIVLDNCEHLIGGCAKVADAILRRCPGVHLIATSREPLGIGGEVIYRVPSMSLPGPEESGSPVGSDAVALFAERAKAQGTGLAVDEATAALVVSVCRRLDGMPLAIELGAARLRSMSLRDLAGRLDDRFKLLTGGSRTAVARQQTLRATVSWSYGLLTGSEQVLLARLSVFAGGFDLEAAEAVCGLGGVAAGDVADLLGSLVDKSLVLAEPAGDALRYRLLETIRQFAAERLADAGEAEAAAVAAAHCGYFLSVAEAAAPHLTGPDQAMWLARLDADQANLRRAADHAAAGPDGTARVLRFAVALRRYHSAPTSFRDEQASRLLAVLARPAARTDRRLFAAALAAAASIAAWVDLAEAMQAAEQSVELARQLDDDRLLIDALTTLGVIRWHAGEQGQGLAAARESVQLAQRLGDDVLLSRSLRACLLFDDLIDPAESGQLFAEAFASAQRCGDDGVKHMLYVSASNYALAACDIPAARAYVEQAILVARTVGLSAWLTLLQLGWVLRAEHDSDQARSTLQTALRTSRRNGDRLGIAYATLGLALLAADTGDCDLAAELHGAAQAAVDRTGMHWEQLEARYRQQSLQHVRAALGDERFDDAYAAGMKLTSEAAIGLALGPPLPAA
jgi:predicted ATPase/class 3 adenylate cyclase